LTHGPLLVGGRESHRQTRHGRDTTELEAGGDNDLGIRIDVMELSRQCGRWGGRLVVTSFFVSQRLVVHRHRSFDVKGLALTWSPAHEVLMTMRVFGCRGVGAVRCGCYRRMS
jgi:hypothetical protein